MNVWSIWLERIWYILNHDILYVFLYFNVLKTALSQGEKEFLEKVFLEAQDVVSSPKLRDRFLKFCVHPTKQICPRSIFLSEKIEKNFFKPHLAKVEEVLKEEHENLTSKTHKLSSNEIFLLGEVETKFTKKFIATKCRQNVKKILKRNPV